jgi:hypothetical protein
MIRPIIEIRIPADVGQQIKKEVYSFGRYEHVVFALVSHAITKDKTLILVKKVFSLAEKDYVETNHHGAMWRGASTVHLINEAIEKKLGIFVLHAHQHKGKVGLSSDDFQSAKSLLPSYQNLIPERPHGSTVLGLEHAAGIALLPGSDSFTPITQVRWLDKSKSDWGDDNPRRSDAGIEPMFHRQVLLIGSRGQQLLAKAKIAVIGLSGGGSHVVQQLAHLGVGEIIGIDSDLVDEQNRHRMIGLSRYDVWLKRKKTKVMQGLARRISHKTIFTAVPSRIPEKGAVDELKRADIVVGCVDSLHARADIHELCQRYLIPYVDIGLLITTKENTDNVQAIGGNVFTMVPGRACLWCFGFLSEQKISAETGGRPRSYFQGTDKQAQVVSFNGVLASAAVNEVLQLVTGYAPPELSDSIKKFDGFAGTLENWVVRKRDSCSSCTNILAAGDPVWRPL